MPCFKRRSLLSLLSPMLRMKLLFWTSSMIMRTMFLSGKSHSNFLQGEAILPISVITSSCWTNKYSTSTLFCLKLILDALREQCNLICSGLSGSKTSIFLREQTVNERFDAGIDQSLKNLEKNRK